MATEKGRSIFRQVPPDVQDLILQSVTQDAPATTEQAREAERTFWALSLCGCKEWLSCASQALYKSPLAGADGGLWRLEALVRTATSNPELASLIVSLPTLPSWDDSFQTDSPDDLVRRVSNGVLALLSNCVNLRAIALPISLVHPCLNLRRTSISELTVSGLGIWGFNNGPSFLEALDGLQLDVLRLEKFNHRVLGSGQSDGELWAASVELMKVLEVVPCKLSFKSLQIKNALLGFQPLLERILACAIRPPKQLSFSCELYDMMYYHQPQFRADIGQSLDFLGYAVYRSAGELTHFSFDMSHLPAGHRTQITVDLYKQLCVPGPLSGDINLFDSSRLPFHHFSIQLPSLRVLKLNCCYRMRVDWVRNIFKRCPALEYVSLANSVWFIEPSNVLWGDHTSVGLEDIFKEFIFSLRCTNVRYLHVGVLPLTEAKAFETGLDQTFKTLSEQVGFTVEYGTCIDTQHLVYGNTLESFES
ncbi:hypothetical protein OIV83_003880 [Microbotryomycetes sp. JL201]|nr:hypothetical protein OIV83_003880 [Microbotryomycetes sp. JL201]